MCATVPNPRLAVAPHTTERKDWISAHTLAWLHLYTKGSLWRTSCVRILVFVGMLERLLRSGDMTLGGVPFPLLCSPVNALSFSYSLCSILSLVSCRLRLLPCQPAPPFTPLPPSGLFIPSTTPHTIVQLLGLNSQCKATMPQLAPAAWDNYFFPHVYWVIFCHWYHDMWERTLMIFSLCIQRLLHARAHHIGFPLS